MRARSLVFVAALAFTSFPTLATAAPLPLPSSSPDDSASLDVRPAQLDRDRSTRIGRTVTIRSRFAGCPVVEPHVACHPSDPGHVLVAAMIVTDIANPYESCRLSSFVSEDAGATWTETAHDWWGYDPWTAILATGETVMSWLGTPGRFGHRFPVQFFTSGDGGASWRPDVQTLAGAHDGTKIATGEDSFWFTTVRFRGDHRGADVVLHRRGDGGDDAFEPAARIERDGQRLNFCEPAVLSDGSVVVPASRFLRDVWVQKYDPASKSLADPVTISNTPGGNRGYMRLAADTSATSPYRDRLYFVRAVALERRGRGVWLNVSSDGGASWSEDRRIDLFEAEARNKAIAASVAVNRDGVVGVSWGDVHEDPEGRAFDIYFAISRDGGASFQRPARITRRSSDPRTKANGDVANKFPGGGHYLGLAARADGSFQLVWSDSRSGRFELQTCDVAIVP